MDGRARPFRQDEDSLTMAVNKSWYLVAYDVRDPIRLRRVAMHLKGYGTRVQFSIFRCRLSERQAARLDWELKKLLAKEDDLMMVGLCAGCLGRVRKRHQNVNWEQDERSFEIV